MKKQAWLQAEVPLILLLSDVWGNEIQQIETSTGRQLLQMEYLSPGIYFLVEVRTGEKLRLVIF